MSFRILRRSSGWHIRFRHTVLTGDDGQRYTVTGLAVIRARSAADLRRHMAQLPEGRA